MNNDSQGVNLGIPNNVIGSDMTANNNGVGGAANPNAANGPIIPIVPIIDGSTQPSDSNNAAEGISTPNIIMDSSNVVNNSNMNVSENINSVNTTLNAVDATNNGGIVTVSNDSLVASVPPVSATLVNETNVNNSESNNGVASSLNFNLPNNDTLSVSQNANNINDVTNDSVSPTGTEVSTSSDANNGVLPVSFNSILSEQKTADSTESIMQTTTSEVTATNNTVTPTDNATVSQPSISTTNDDANVISIAKYLGHMFLFIIPIVGLVMLILKVVDKKDKGINNFAKASLAFGAVMCIVFGGLIAFGIHTGLISININGSDSATQVDDTYLYE